MAKNMKNIIAEQEEPAGASLKARRAGCYVFLVLISFICLFWFYVLFINATRSNSQLARGFTALPSTCLGTNLHNLFSGTLPVISGLCNSLVVASFTALLATYFSTMTAYAIHAYDFKLRKAAFTFILAVMMIPTQVTALGFIQLMTKMNLMDNFIPLIVPAMASPAVFFYQSIRALTEYVESKQG